MSYKLINIKTTYFLSLITFSMHKEWKCRCDLNFPNVFFTPIVRIWDYLDHSRNKRKSLMSGFMIIMSSHVHFIVDSFSLFHCSQSKETTISISHVQRPSRATETVKNIWWPYLPMCFSNSVSLKQKSVLVFTYLKIFLNIGNT